MAALKPIYTALDADAARAELDALSASYTANAAWLALAATAFNILRAAGAAASARHARARWATLRTHLVTVPARVASTARRLVLHLPMDWPWAPAWEDLWATATN